MKYPLHKYKFYYDRNDTIIAAATYGGHVVKGYAKLDPRDTYREEAGQSLAAARCNAKIALKRQKRAAEKYLAAMDAVAEARRYEERMKRYFDDSCAALEQANLEVAAIAENL